MAAVPLAVAEQTVNLLEQSKLMKPSNTRLNNLYHISNGNFCFHKATRSGYVRYASIHELETAFCTL